MLAPVQPLATTPKTQEKPRTKKWDISPVEADMLRVINDFHVVTVKQAMTLLHYSPKAQNYVRQVLTTLERKGYLLRTFLDRASQFGTAPSIFTIASKAAKYFVAHEIEVKKRYTPLEFREEVSDDFLYHAAIITDVLISAVLLEETQPGYPLFEFRNEHVLQQTPVYLENSEKGKKIKVLPDSWLKFQLPTKNEQGRHNTLPFILEVDRGMHSVTSIKQQLRARVHYINGPYQQAFHTTTVTIGYAVKCKTAEKSIRRAALLRSLCEEVLTEEERIPDGQFFLFTSLPEGTIDPATLWLSPVWSVPFSESLHIAVDVNA